jgi:hypothetical protein
LLRNISLGDIGGEKPTCEDLSDLDEYLGDYARIDIPGQRDF